MFVIENDNKKSDLVDHIFMLLNRLQATEKPIVADIVLNEDQVLQAESLRCDINDAFTTMYKMDPHFAFDLSRSHEVLDVIFKQLDSVIDEFKYITTQFLNLLLIWYIISYSYHEEMWYR